MQRIEAQWRLAGSTKVDGDVFLGPDWYYSWSETFGASRDRGAMIVTAGDGLQALLPLVVERRHAVMGSRLSMASVADTAPDFVDLLVSDGDAAHCLASIAEQLPREFPDWSLLEFSGLQTDSALVEHRAALASLGTVQFDLTGECPAVDLSGDYASYLRDRFDKKKRYNIERQVKIATEQQGLSLVRADTPAAVERCLGELFQLHELRKSAMGTPSSFATPLSRQFHSRLALRLLERGQLGLFVLRSADRPVSAMYGFFGGRNFFFYQSGLDPTWSKYSVGTVLLTLVLRQCFEMQLATFHFLRGDESYKSTWANKVYPYGRLRTYRRSARGKLQHWNHRARAQLKEFIKARGRKTGDAQAGGAQ